MSAKPAADITPGFRVEALLRQQTELCREHGYKAAFFVAMTSNGELRSDMCGMEKKDILWALEVMKLQLIDGDD